MKKFALELEPVDYQLTVHYHNYEASFYKGAFIQHLNIVSALDASTRDYAVMSNFIRHYGKTKIEKFLDEVIQIAYDKGA